MQTMTVTSKNGGALVFDPTQFLGKFTKDGGRIVALEFSNDVTLEGYLVRSGCMVVWVDRTAGIYDTDPTATEKR